LLGFSHRFLGAPVSWNEDRHCIIFFQISDGGNVTRIVELFRLNFNDVVKPQSIGEVHLINVREGVVSDDTCRSDPCMNGGTCHVTWNDYR
jgi:protein crumbs